MVPLDLGSLSLSSGIQVALKHSQCLATVSLSLSLSLCLFLSPRASPGAYPGAHLADLLSRVSR